MKRQKEIERQYTEEARKVCSFFPAGELVDHERPDFLLNAATGVLGIEVTELCFQEPRREAARLMHVPRRAKERFNCLAGVQPIDVSIAFNWRSEEVPFQELTESLVEFVYKHRDRRGSDFNIRELPKGYCHVGIHEALDRPDRTGHWQGPRAFSKGVAPRELIELRIAEKNEKVPEYRQSASIVWLLLVSDQFIGPGEVYVRPDHLAQWEFVFHFDKVLLFTREIGGGGEVVDVQRKLA